MKSILPSVLTTVRFLLLGSLMCVPVLGAATLADFGYANKPNTNAIPLLLILAHFNDNGNPAFIGDTNDWDHYLLDTSAPSNTVNGYFNEVSIGRFQYLRAGVVHLDLPTSQKNPNYVDMYPDDIGLADRLYTSNILHQAMRVPGVDFSSFNSNNDDYVTPNELSIAIVNNEEFVAGRGSGNPKLPGSDVEYRGLVSHQKNSFSSSAFEGMCHEIMHVAGAVDIYGAWSSSVLLHQGLSMMSSSGGTIHIDAWHKLQFGWSTPRIRDLKTGGREALLAATSGELNAPSLLYDSSRGTQEYFLLEYRSWTNSTRAVHYDRNLVISGMVLWHVYQTNKWPVQYGELVYPTAEPGWRECIHCRSMIHQSRTNMPCASVDSPNGWHHAFNAHKELGDNHRLVDENVAGYGGQPGWRHCGKCGCLFYYPNRLQSVCAADGANHVTLGGSSYYQLRMNVPDIVGHTYWHRCINCQVLFFENRTGDYGFSDCPAPGQTRHISSGDDYVLIARWGHLTVMAEAAPNLLKAHNVAWTGGMTTPHLRWYNGAPTPYSIKVHPFNEGASQITVEWLNESDTWVHFNYVGTETGSFSQPYNTFYEGITEVGRGGTIKIKTGQSAESAHVIKPMKIKAYNGPAVIGR